MTKEGYFKKVRAALAKRRASTGLTLSETLRVCHLQASGFSAVATANVLIAGRSIKLEA